MEGNFPKPEAKKKSENDLESAENLSVPQRVKKLIKEKYKFKSLNDFYQLDREEKIDVLKESLCLIRNSNYHNEDISNFQWELACKALGLEEKYIFPESEEKIKEEYLDLLSKYENLFKERFRQDAIKRRNYSDENNNDTGAKFYRELSSRNVTPANWYDLPLVEKKAINDNVFAPINFKDSSVWSNSIRFGYALIGKSGEGLTGYLKDRFNRSDRDKKQAEEAIYDRRFIEYYLRAFSPRMPKVPVGEQEEKTFNDLNSPDMNAAKATAWMQGMNVEEDLRQGIIEAYEKADQEKGKQD